MNQFLKLKKLKTLLIDDNVTVRDTMRMIFAQKGCPLKAYETAEEGLQALERERYDIIISDLKLPGINGVEFFKRAMRSHPDTVRILISGYGDQSTVSEAFDIGVHAFIKKPFSLTIFLEQLMPHIEKYHERISQIRDSARTGAALENSDQAQTADYNINGSRLTKVMHGINLMSYLPPDSKKNCDQGW
jgi:DNA-binding NtrC family response regulator